MLKRLYRQRRRFVLVCILVIAVIVVGIASGSASSDILTFSNPIMWIALILTVALVAISTVLIITFVVADIRNIVEIGILALAAEAALRLALPGGGPNGMMSIVLFVSLFFVIERLLYGQITDRFTRRNVRPRKIRFATKATPEEAWAALALLPEHTGSHWYPKTRISRAPDGQGDYLVSYPIRDGQSYQLEAVKVEEADKPHRFLFSFEPPDPRGETAGLGGRSEVEIAPLADGGSQVTFSEARDASPLRRRLQWFLDDEFADRVDSMRAQLDGRRDWSFFARQFARG